MEVVAHVFSCSSFTLVLLSRFFPIQKEITQNNDRFTELHSKTRQLDINYKDKDKEDVATRDDMEVVFEDKYTASAEPYPEICLKTMTFEKQLRMAHMVPENVEIELFLVLLADHLPAYIWHTASLVAKLYTKKQDSTAALSTEIHQQRLELEMQVVALEEQVRSHGRTAGQGDHINNTEMEEEEVKLFLLYTIDYNQNKHPIIQCT
ncbi:hypothetical protein BG005_008265 [Podila minutissima]|nr:hypothetical protein BG005_008265 [Podila minutissima]